MKLFDSKFLGRRPSLESSQQSHVNRRSISSPIAQSTAAALSSARSNQTSILSSPQRSTNSKAVLISSATSVLDSSSSVSCSTQHNNHRSGHAPHVSDNNKTKIDEDDLDAYVAPPIVYSAASSSHPRQLVILNSCDVMRGGRGAASSLVVGGGVAGRRRLRRRLPLVDNSNNLHNLGPRPILLSNMLLFAFVLICCVGVQPIAALQYDIWFKYPHPYTKVDPVQYCKEDIATPDCRSQMPVYTNTLDSEKTLIPYTYNQFDFCPSVEANTYEYSARTEWDDHIRLSSFDIKFLRNEDCKLLCKKEYRMMSHIDLYRLEELRLGLSRQYYHHWFTDNFPTSWCFKQNPLQCFIGFPMGFATDERGQPEDRRIKLTNSSAYKPNAVYIFNHFDFTIIYESGVGKEWGGGPSADKMGRITAIRVSPRSITHNTTGANKCGADLAPMEIPPYYHYGQNLTLRIYYSYSIKFVQDESMKWEQRWKYLESTLPGTASGRITLILAILLLFALAAPTAYSFIRTFFSDRRLGLLNQSDSATWKLIANDVFREPSQPQLFSILVGAGTQYIVCIILSEILSIFMYLTSTTFFVLIVLFFVAMLGFCGGYVAVRLYKTFGGATWKKNCFLVGLLNPVVVISCLFVSRNLLLLFQGSLIALPVGPIGALFILALVYGLCLPSTFAGGHFANRNPSIEFPVRPTANPREIPLQPLYFHPAVGVVVSGLIPFLSFLFVESYPFYDNGGWIITCIAVLICLQTAISTTYFFLAREEHRWWWITFASSGFGAVYYLVHSLIYISTTLILDGFMTTFLYFSFAFFLCLALFLLTSTLGFMAGFFFVWRIYSQAQPSPDMNYAVFHKESNNN